MLGFRLTVSDYPQMLSKLAWIIAFNTFAATNVVLHNFEAGQTVVDWANQQLAQHPIPLIGFQLTVASLAAALVAFASHAVRLHDRLSDLLHIRAKFDIDSILLPMLALTGPTVTSDQLDNLSSKRGSLMSRVFYRYNSSGEGDGPVVSSHTRKEALTSWSWYWVFLESVFVYITCAVICLLIGAYMTASIVFTVCVTLIIIMSYLKAEVRRYAWYQVIDIANDSERRSDIRSAFEASL